ncbi:RNA-dependent RNA polymerase [Heracleum sosnowskyi]|uniref:RNA-dependent RNA polymerase n=1 Tax=Heracleum sosnowskyi TaxID=360622 RepID=A0AAD8ILH2_9APIA|nr:RNA-dependent RNA polymerase [Heracleum sosnowskyi]
MGRTIHVSGFRYLVPAEDLKELLEKYTGKDTVYALEVKESRTQGNAPYARIQFINSQNAEYIIALADQRRLWYGTRYLKAWAKDIDIIKKPRVRTVVDQMEHATLHFGCQISKQRFSVFWKKTDVSVQFGSGLHKFYFSMSHESVDYKLQLSSENIWKIELRHPRGQIKKFILIQLTGAPRIFKKLKDSVLSFYLETQEDHWVRATDFTPSLALGQSSALCLEIPHGTDTPDFGESVIYQQNDGHFELESGSTFCNNLDLVPMSTPPRQIRLSYKIYFKICILVQNGYIPGPAIDDRFYRLVRVNEAFTEHALEKLNNLKECCYDPVKWFSEEYIKYSTSRRQWIAPAITLDAGLVYVRRLQITPSRVFFCGPEVNVSNRVLRNFSKDIDNFLRISFVDEEWNKLFSTDLYARKRKTGIYERILSILKNGIVIGNKKFDFLAFSSSQLRDNSAWMFASTENLSASDIRNWMGDFSDIRNVAKCAARLGQSFSSSTETLTVPKNEIEIIPDVENGTRYVFSDGIGKVSKDFARKVAIKCDLKSSTPSAFQIRYGGYKGVVAVDPTSSWKLSLRKSMCKYVSSNIGLDVLAWSKYQPCYLNRQVISLLSTLGVKDHVFEKIQREAVDQLDMILDNPLRAQEALDLMYQGEHSNVLKEMLKCGYMPKAEPFLLMMLQTFRASKLLDLRTKSRIFVRGGRSMMGCLDETRSLEYGQVFVQYSGDGRRAFYDDSLMMHCDDGRKRIAEGKVLVAKNPCLHPGDIRVLKAVNVPALEHMVDCVVFPQKGTRPHPNECSGSDLDGDIYFVCWDHDLIPPKLNQPMDYTSAAIIQLDHEVTIEEIQEYFANYIVNDSLGMIANAHTVFADKEPSKAMSEHCLELAKLFSVAVDFPKTGVAAELPSNLRVTEYPDFMEKPDKTTYVSERVLGKLFRDVKRIAPDIIKSFTKEVAEQAYDCDMQVDGFRDYLDDAFEYKSEYDYQLGNLMDYYGIKTEAEILSGNIMKLSKSFDRRKDAEAISLAVKSLRKNVRTWFNKNHGPSDGGIDILYAKASAWYHVTYHPDYWGVYNEGLDRPHFLSFPWCVYDKLIHIKKEKMSQTANVTAMLQRFNIR